jgi:hypothetical protein
VIVIEYEMPDLYYVQADRPIEQRLVVLHRTVQRERSCGPKESMLLKGGWRWRMNASLSVPPPLFAELSYED